MKIVYIVQRFTSINQDEDSAHYIAFVTESLDFARKKVEVMVDDEIERFNKELENKQHNISITKFDYRSYIINNGDLQTFIEYLITEHEII